MEKRVKDFAIQALRRGSYKWAARNEALKRAKVAYGTYRCNICGKDFRRKDIQLDHKVPVIPTTGWECFDSYIERLYCSADNFQCLCILCHSAKTALEATERAVERKTPKRKKKTKKCT